MSADRAQVGQQLRGPRHLLAGKWRRRMERLTVAATLVPALVVVLVVAYVGAVASVWMAVPFVAALAALVVFVPLVRTYVAFAWWRSRWYWDARAGGLAVEAEPSVFAKTDRLTDAHIVVVPTVTLRMLANGTRSYRVRPLPGQTIGDFEAAVPRLAMRWGCQHVSIEAPLGERFVTLTAHQSAPPTSEYARAS